MTYLKIFKEGKLCESLAIKLKRTGHTNYAVKPNSGALILASVASFSAFRPREQNLDEAGSDEAIAHSASWNFLYLSPICALSESGKALCTTFLLMVQGAI